MFRPHRVFLWIAAVFGFLLMVMTPAFQPQDENCHFYRAWQVSEGTFSAVKQDQRLGGYIPESLVTFYTDFHPCVLNRYNRISPGQLWEARRIPLEPGPTVFIDYTNTALYSALLYLPQALGISIGKLFGAGPFWLIYLGRLCNLLVFITLVYYAIKILPVKKWLFVVLATLPMSLVVHSSLSADVLVNSLLFLVLAVILKYSFDEAIRQITYRHILFIMFLAVLTGLVKLVYVPVLFLLVLIPPRKFSSSWIRIAIIILAVVAGMGTAYIQKSAIDKKYIPYSEYNEDYRDYTALKKGSDINKQAEFIKEHPWRTVRVLARSVVHETRYMARGYAGMFGWGHIYPPSWFICLVYLVILLLVLPVPTGETAVGFTVFQRCFTGLIVLVVTVLIMLSQYLSWDLVGEDRAYPLIGRYFIPVLPWFFLMFSDLFKGRPGLSVHKTVSKGVIAFSMIGGLLSIYMILVNSYTLTEYAHPKWQVRYSFKEHINDTGSIEYIISGSDTLAAFSKPAGSYVTGEKVLSGPSSLKLSNNNPYGFTLKVYGARAKDKLVASCRSYGRGCYLDFQEYPEGINYWALKAWPQKDSLGWKYHEVHFIVPHNIPDDKELRVFAWWPYTDSVYLDSFCVKYFEKE